MNLDTQTEISTLHSTYCCASGMTDVSLSMERIFIWERWLFHRRPEPWTERELRLVIAYIKSKIRANERRIASLQFRNLIGDPGRFEEDLAAAKATARNTIPRTERARVLEATGRTAYVPPDAKTAGQIISESAKLAAMLAQWKTANPL